MILHLDYETHPNRLECIYLLMYLLWQPGSHPDPQQF